MEVYLFAFITTGLVALTIFWLLFSVSRNRHIPTENDGKLVLRHSSLFRLFAILLFLGLLLMVGTLSFIVPPSSMRGISLLVAGAAIASILGLVLLWETFQYSLTVSEAGLDCVSPWRGKRFIGWGDIKQVSFSHMNMWFGVETNNGSPFHVMAFVPGVSQFLEKCEAKLESKKLLAAESGYPWVWRKFPEIPGHVPLKKPWLAKLVIRLGMAAVVLSLLGIGLFCLNGLVLASGEKPVVREFKVSRVNPHGGKENEVVVLSYNIAKGFAHKGGIKFDETDNVMNRLDRMAKVIQLTQPDFVCLSEIMTEAGMMPLDQVEYVARATGLPYTLFGENYNLGLPGYRVVGGNAILSRTPISPVANISLMGRKPFYETKNSRRALFGEVEINGEKVLIGSLHNDSYSLENNKKQIEQILQFIGDRPTILAGDFNANPKSLPINAVEESGKFVGMFYSGKKDEPAKTFPSHKPDQHLDYIFGPKSWKHLETTVFTNQFVLQGRDLKLETASDHLPVFSVFELPVTPKAESEKKNEEKKSEKEADKKETNNTADKKQENDPAPKK